MKKHFLLFLASGALLFGAIRLLGAPSASDDNKTRPVALQVKVTLPSGPWTNTPGGDDIAEAFGYRMATALHEKGFQGRVVYLDRADRTVAAVPILALDLVEWRINPIGNVDCRFNATIRSATASKSLGSFTGMGMFAWQDQSFFERQGKFDDAVTDTAGELLKKIKASGVLPQGSN